MSDSEPIPVRSEADGRFIAGGARLAARRRWEGVPPEERIKAARKASRAAKRARKADPERAKAIAKANAGSISPEAARARGRRISAALLADPEAAKARALKSWATRRKNARKRSKG